MAKYLGSLCLSTNKGVTFKYDLFGRRIYKSSSSGTSVYAYDGDNLIEGTNSSGAVVARYTQTQNIDEPLAMLRSAATSYYQADGLGSITSLSNAAGALAQTYTFDSFRKQTASSGSLTNPFQYTARESDTETGLYYYRARFYDPAAGRFKGEDPTMFNGGLNFYAYVRNDPANLFDPRGESPCLNIDGFLKYMDDKASGKTTPSGACAQAVRNGLQYGGGLDTTGHPKDAKDYGPFLKRIGFQEVPGSSPQPGDIMVFQPGPSPFGHVQAWDGKQWVSDYMQPNNTGVYPGTHYRDSKAPFQLYRFSQPCQ